jgi:hypothetical protein
MDLPTCPSCGQSVLDDDVAECPFCGASMSGKGSSSPKASGGDSARKTAPAGASSAASEKPRKTRPKSRSDQRGSRTVADDDDPFEVGAGRVAANVLQARPKPSKGRLHRVVCPMCDKPGFVPRSAIGKQVRCANPDCLVPVFNVPDPKTTGDERSGAQSSDSVAVDSQGISPSAGSPMKIYVISAVVLVPLALLLVFFLNRPAAEDPNADEPPVFDWDAIVGGDETASTEDANDTADAEIVARSPVSEAGRLVKRMISTARLEGNRDKAYARRLTADAFVRLNRPEEAAQELGQLATVARQISVGRLWLQIEPRLTQYWQYQADGNDAAARDVFKRIQSGAAKLTTRGRLAFETLIGAAAAMINEGEIEAAQQLITKHDRDHSVLANRDVMNSAACFQSVSRLRAAGLDPFAVGDIFFWEDAVRTGVAVDLATHKEWAAAVEWSKAQSAKRSTGDCLAAVADVACGLKAARGDLDLILAAAAAADPQIGLRVKSVIAGETRDADLFAECSQQMSAQPAAEPMPLPPLTQLIRSSTPSFSMEPMLPAAAAAEFARAAVLLDDQAAAETGIRHLFLQLASIAPATPTIRRAILELEQRESQVRKRIGTELRISSSQQIASQFRKYRRALDHYAVTAERRRLYLLQRLARIIRAGGVDPIRSVMSDETMQLKQEVVMDELSRLLAASAARSSIKIEEIESPDQALIVRRPSRLAPLPEAALSTTLVRAWSAADAGKLREAVKSLDSGRNLPGFREALLIEIIEQAASTATSPDQVYRAIASLTNPVWREEALQIASRILARRGMTAEAEAWLDNEKVPPTELVTAFYGLILGLLEQS